MSLLLDSGLDTNTIIGLCFKESNNILKVLSEGKSLIDVLCNDQKSKYFKLIHILAGNMSLRTAIKCADKIDTSTNEVSKNFLSKIAYPVFIFCFAYFMILFFSNSIVPSMITYSEEQKGFLLLDLLTILFSILFIMLVLFIVVLIIYHLFDQSKERMLPVLMKMKIFRLYTSIQFSILLNALLSCNLSSFICFEVLSKMYFFKEVHYFAKNIYKDLSDGKTLELSIDTKELDETFKIFFKIGMKASNLASILNIYSSYGITSFKKIVNKTILSIQIFSYSCVGLLVLVVYQIMLMPLNMLNTI